MKLIEWQGIMFVGLTMVHEYWIYYGLPRIYYMEAKNEYFENK